MNDLYLTIEKSSEGLFKDKGSRFLSYAFPVTSEDEIKEHLRQLKKEHYAARHNCYAWQLGVEEKRFRTNDDGEPSSTAGKPILTQIQRRDLTNVLVVVVRYFGGRLLGTGGLIKAYGAAAADALNKATIIEKHSEVLLSIEFGYLRMNEVMRVLRDHNLPQSHSDFGLVCTVKTTVRKSRADNICEYFRKIEGTKVDMVDNLSDIDGKKSPD